MTSILHALKRGGKKFISFKTECNRHAPQFLFITWRLGGLFVVICNKLRIKAMTYWKSLFLCTGLCNLFLLYAELIASLFIFKAFAHLHKKMHS